MLCDSDPVPAYPRPGTATLQQGEVRQGQAWISRLDCVKAAGKKGTLMSSQAAVAATARILPRLSLTANSGKETAGGGTRQKTP